MQEPSPRISPLAIARGISAVLILVGGGFLIGRVSSERPTAPAVGHPLPRISTEVDVRAAGPVKHILDRADLIDLAAAATDAFAAGQPPSADVIASEGRHFEVRIPFGCSGGTIEDVEPMRWRYDAEKSALRIHVEPASWNISEWLSDNAAETKAVEAVEGFWISRPWSASEACPPISAATAPGVQPATSTQQTLALAQFFTEDGSRQGRRNGKAYEAVLKIKPTALVTSLGFRLLITGKIVAAPGGSPVVCRQPAGADQRPICVIATTMDEISIENGATGEILSSWTTDRAQAATAR